MIVRCTSCNSAYSVDDSKVTGKKFAFGCPKCSANVIIDNRIEAVSPAPAAEDAFAAQEQRTPAENDFDFGGINEAAEDNSGISFGGETPDDEEKAFSFDDDDSMLTSFTDDAKTEEEDDFLSSFNSDMSSSAAISSSSSFDDILKSTEDSPFGEIESDDEIDLEPEIDLSVLGSGKTDEPSFDFDTSSAVSENPFDAAEDDEKISINLDELDVPFVEESDIEDEKISVDLGQFETDDEPKSNVSDMDDESITLDLDSLDLDLEESAEISAGDRPEASFETNPLEEDESITLDLNSLDLDLEDTNEILSGDKVEEDTSRLSLSDAGISFNEIEGDETSRDSSDNLRISLADVGEDFAMDAIAENENATDAESFGELLPESFENDLPEIDIDRFSSEQKTSDDSILELSDDYEKYESDITGYGESRETSGSGYINFSIDYSIKYSRLGVLGRLLGIFTIALIPHYLVLLVYSLLSAIICPINQLLILITGRSEDDYILVHEKTLRYSAAISAFALDLIEDFPRFAGNSNMDYQLQMNIMRPVFHSRVLAFLRLTGIGILAAALPHLILLAILSFGAGFLSFIGIFAVLFSGRWPGMIFDFMVRYYRYAINISAYVCGDIDSYPSFRFD